MKRRYHWSILLAVAAVLIALSAAGDGRLWGQKAEVPLVSIAGSESFIYVLELQGTQMGEYPECLGLGSYNEVEEQVVITTTGNVVMQKTPGVLQWHKITLKRGTPSDPRIWQWRKTMEDTGLAASLREGRIILYQAGSSQPLAQWTFHRAWPAELVFDGAQEKLVILHEGIELTGATGGMGGTTTRR